jgi:hypothetical protein
LKKLQKKGVFPINIAKFAGCSPKPHPLRLNGEGEDKDEE